MDSPSEKFAVNSVVSDNIAYDNKGFLVITNIIAARTGSQEYLGRELGVADPKLQDVIFTVERPPDVVFNKRSLKSYESAIFTDGHPKEDVSPKNIKRLGKGFIRNARKGEPDENGNETVVVDAIITDESLMKVIESGDKREVSVGYSVTFKDIDLENKRVIIDSIEVNHLALVSRGRAGTATIKDEDILEELHVIEDLEVIEVGKKVKKETYQFKVADEIYEISTDKGKDYARKVALELGQERKKNNV